MSIDEPHAAGGSWCGAMHSSCGCCDASTLGAAAWAAAPVPVPLVGQPLVMKEQLEHEIGAASAQQSKEGPSAAAAADANNGGRCCAQEIPHDSNQAPAVTRVPRLRLSSGARAACQQAANVGSGRFRSMSEPPMPFGPSATPSSPQLARDSSAEVRRTLAGGSCQHACDSKIHSSATGYALGSFGTAAHHADCHLSGVIVARALLLCSYIQAKAQYEASGLQRPSVRAAMDAIVRFSALRDSAGPAFIEAHSLTTVCTYHNMAYNTSMQSCGVSLRSTCHDGIADDHTYNDKHRRTHYIQRRSQRVAFPAWPGVVALRRCRRSGHCKCTGAHDCI